MAIKIGTFERDLRVATGGLTGPALNALLARSAKEALGQTIASGAGTTNYQRAVNGRLGAVEEAVRAPGPIVYAFNHLDEVVLYALMFARARSPKASGRYRDSWFAMVNGMPWNRSTPIPPGAEVIVTNDEPYSRKIEVGAMRMSLPPHVVEDTRQALFKRYGYVLAGAGLTVARRFIPLRNGYVLKGRSRRVRAAQSDMSSAHRAGREFLASRKDTRAGEPMKYPALAFVEARFR